MTAAPTPDFRVLYRRAFAAFGAIALWNKREISEPSPGHALVIARALRIEGNMAARRLAEAIEASVRPKSLDQAE